MSFHYLCCGLLISSDIRLIELVEVDAVPIADVNIQRSDISVQGLPDPAVSTLNFHASANEFWLRIPDMARFRVSAGKLIEYDCEKGLDEQTLRLFLLGSCLGILLHQRNLLVLHGNAVRMNDTCVVFAGASGSGKSSLAAAFHQQGFDVLTDDICAINSSGMVQPSYPQLKVWQDTAEHLNIDTADMKRIRFQIAKFAYRLQSGFCQSPTPVSIIYLLAGWNKDNVAIEPLHGSSKLMPVRHHTYRLNYLEAMGSTASHMQACSKLANNTRVAVIHRPMTGFHVSEIIDLVRADVKLTEHPNGLFNQQ